MLDHEQQQSYQFSVCVNDSPKDRSQKKQSIAQVTVNVLNVNDNKPRFLPDSYTFNVNENCVRCPIGTVVAKDDDNDAITYSLTGSRSQFRINSKNGTIR